MGERGRSFIGLEKKGTNGRERERERCWNEEEETVVGGERTVKGMERRLEYGRGEQSKMEREGE